MAAELPLIHVDRPVVDADLDHVADRARLTGPDDDTLVEADGAIIGAWRQWDAERFSLFPKLRVLSRAGIGYDNVDVAAAEAAGVVACNAPDSPTVSTAEHTIALMLSITKELTAKQQRAVEGLGGPAVATSLELDGATLGLVGLGRIARRVAVAAQGLGMVVVAHDPFLEVSPIVGVDLVELSELWAVSHVVSLHAPLAPETRHMLDADVFAQLRPGAYIVNCARGPLVDHDALLEALDAGQVAGAGLDVTDPEPLPKGHALLGRSDVVVTPHIASSTAVGRRRLFEHAFENALAVLEGRPASVVTTQS